MSQNKVWIFAFADLAFLLLIAFSQSLGQPPQKLVDIDLSLALTPSSTTEQQDLTEGILIFIYPPTLNRRNFSIHNTKSESTEPVQEDKRLTLASLSEKLTKALSTEEAKGVSLRPSSFSTTGDTVAVISLLNDLGIDGRNVKAHEVTLNQLLNGLGNAPE